MGEGVRERGWGSGWGVTRWGEWGGEMGGLHGDRRGKAT